MRPAAFLYALLFATSVCATEERSSNVPATRSHAWSPGEQRLGNGSTIYYQRSGSGRPLILMHTLRTQAEYFAGVAPRLANYYTVYALDLPGHGRSSLDRVNYDEPYLRAEVRDFIELNDLRDVTLVGESLGGVLALTVATEIPGRIARIVSINPYDYGEKLAGGIRRSRNGWILGLFTLFRSHTIETQGALAAVLRGGFHDPTRLSPDFVRLVYQSGRRAGFRRAEYSLCKSWYSWIEARDLYGKIAGPVELLYTSFDWSRPEEREDNRRLLRPEAFFTIENTGHFASLENPEAVVRAVLNFDSAAARRSSAP
jgi:pimeloyl-ACP methyl ester carboxylesterase